MFADVSLFNAALAKVPMNWAVVFAVASLWLLLFHTVMTAWAAMTSSGQQSFNAPGQVASPVASTAAAFSRDGLLGTTVASNGLDRFIGGPTAIWTDGTESKYAEDGWIYNP